MREAGAALFHTLEVQRIFIKAFADNQQLEVNGGLRRLQDKVAGARASLAEHAQAATASEQSTTTLLHNQCSQLQAFKEQLANSQKAMQVRRGYSLHALKPPASQCCFC